MPVDTSTGKAVTNEKPKTTTPIVDSSDVPSNVPTNPEDSDDEEDSSKAADLDMAELRIMRDILVKYGFFRWTSRARWSIAYKTAIVRASRHLQTHNSRWDVDSIPPFDATSYYNESAATVNDAKQKKQTQKAKSGQADVRDIRKRQIKKSSKAVENQSQQAEASLSSSIEKGRRAARKQKISSQPTVSYPESEADAED